MTPHALAQCALYLVLLVALATPLGAYMACVYDGRRHPLARVLGPLERTLYRWSGVDPGEGMAWPTYAGALLAFNLAGLVLLYALQRLQGLLPLNPQGLPAVPADLALGTAISFATNTNWQAYVGETTLSHLTQMLGLTVQNFVSAATGMAVLVALIRALRARCATTIGNFWVDLVRGTLYVLLPLSTVMAVGLVSQGVVQTLRPSVSVDLVEPSRDVAGRSVTQQTIALGPVASQVAIKQLGTNGGGYYGANSAHPLENPTPLSSFVQALAILLLPAALCLTYGRMIGDRRQGWALLLAMLLIFVPLLSLAVWSEQQGNPALDGLGVAEEPTALAAGGNMEGKEVRFGPTASALWAAATTAASNGSVNAMHDSLTPLGGLVTLVLIDTGEVVFGGVGSGLYGLLAFVVIAVFVAGLMVGRTPEYLGKKIEAFEMKMAALVVLVPAMGALVGAAVATATPTGRGAVLNPGPHGFTEILYAFASATHNNGSAFGGLAVNTPFYNLGLGLCMLVGRYWLAIPVLAVAGSLARKTIVPSGPGTLPTHTPLFVLFLVAVIVLVGVLTYLPALALGPIVEQLIQRG